MMPVQQMYGGSGDSVYVFSQCYFCCCYGSVFVVFFVGVVVFFVVVVYLCLDQILYFRYILQLQCQKQVIVAFVIFCSFP